MCLRNGTDSSTHRDCFSCALPDIAKSTRTHTHKINYNYHVTEQKTCRMTWLGTGSLSCDKMSFCMPARTQSSSNILLRTLGMVEEAMTSPTQFP